jgi:polar amino acid transport system substrate-binding protein
MLRCFIAVVFLSVASFSQAESKTLTVCTNSWAPFTGESLPGMGKTWRVIQAIMEPQGYITELQFMPWARALKSVESGDCDALPDAFHTKERSVWAWYSAPYSEVKTVFFKRKDKQILFNTLADLKGLTIGVIRGAAVNPDFDHADYLKKQEVVDERQGLAMLHADRIDLYVTGDLSGLHQLTLMTEKHPNITQEIEIITPYLAKNKLHLAISKKAKHGQTILRDFNQGLADLIKSGEYHSIFQSNQN